MIDLVSKSLGFATKYIIIQSVTESALNQIMRIRNLFLIVFAVAALTPVIFSQPPAQKQPVRSVTIPISIFTKTELKENQAAENIQIDRLLLKEDRDEQQILSIRSVSDAPMSIAIVIQEDLSPNFNLQLDDIREFIRNMPKGTRVMVAYLRSGSSQIQQRFTDDLERASKSLRVVAGSSVMAPRSPFDGVSDILGRFDGVPAGRRAILLFSDGLDTSGGLNLASVAQSFDLDIAVLKAQRKSVAVYSFYAPTTTTDNGNSTLALAAQGALGKLSDETGGRAFIHGLSAPLNYLSYFRELSLSLKRQFALTFLSTHMDKGYHKLVVQSTNPEIRIEHPRGYYYR